MTVYMYAVISTLIKKWNMLTLLMCDSLLRPASGSGSVTEITKVTILFLLKFAILVIFGLMRLFPGETE